jgi:hypothetical protein
MSVAIGRNEHIVGLLPETHLLHEEVATASLTIGGSDCEFIDAEHVGDVGTLGMALAMARAPGSPLARVVDRIAADPVIGENSGAAMLRSDFAGNVDRETDLPNLGCCKPQLGSGRNSGPGR